MASFTQWILNDFNQGNEEISNKIWNLLEHHDVFGLGNCKVSGQRCQNRTNSTLVVIPVLEDRGERKLLLGDRENFSVAVLLEPGEEIDLSLHAGESIALHVFDASKVRLGICYGSGLPRLGGAYVLIRSLDECMPLLWCNYRPTEVIVLIVDNFPWCGKGVFSWKFWECGLFYRL